MELYLLVKEKLLYNLYLMLVNFNTLNGLQIIGREKEIGFLFFYPLLNVVLRITVYILMVLYFVEKTHL